MTARENRKGQALGHGWDRICRACPETSWDDPCGPMLAASGPSKRWRQDEEMAMGETAEARDVPVGLPGGRPNQFALPRGPLGWLAGRLMSRGNDITNRDVASRLDIAPGERVLEVGYGPGGLLRLLLEQTPAALVAGGGAPPGG